MQSCMGHELRWSHVFLVLFFCSVFLKSLYGVGRSRPSPLFGSATMHSYIWPKKQTTRSYPSQSIIYNTQLQTYNLTWYNGSGISYSAVTKQCLYNLYDKCMIACMYSINRIDGPVQVWLELLRETVDLLQVIHR